MIIIGITGNSGAGKSTVCEEILRITKSKIIDADKLAKSLDFQGSKYLQEIKDLFGKEIINTNNTLDRKILASIIYNDTSKKKELDKITFKYVVKETENEIQKCSKEDLDYIIIDAPLLFEANIDKKCDYVISVIASKNIKIKRICKRDCITEKTANSRLSIQKNDEFFIKNSDFIIENHENIKKLREEIERIFSSINESRRI